MLKIIYDLLVKNNIVVRGVEEPNEWEQHDAQITLDDFSYIQISDTYLILWRGIPNVMSHRLECEVSLDELDNTSKVLGFIEKVKTIITPSKDDLYDYSAE
jgi:hypothetical protein